MNTVPDSGPESLKLIPEATPRQRVSPRIGSRCATSQPPTPPPPLTLLCGQEPATAPASAASPPSPLQLSVRAVGYARWRRDHARHTLANRLPLRSFPTPLPHPPLILLRASFNYCLIVGRLAPFSPPTLHPTPQSRYGGDENHAPSRHSV